MAADYVIWNGGRKCNQGMEHSNIHTHILTQNCTVENSIKKVSGLNQYSFKIIKCQNSLNIRHPFQVYVEPEIIN